MRFFKFSSRTVAAAAPKSSAMFETIESRRLLSGTGLSGHDDGALHDANDNHGTVEVIHNQRGRNGADDGANHDVNDTRRGRGADDGANHDVNDNRRGRGADDSAGHH